MQEFWRRSATEVVALLQKREVLPSELIDVAARRIAETNPLINAMVTLCLDRARDHARRLEAHPVKNAPPNHLHGLPIAVKDNIDVEGVRCTSGSRLFEHRIAPASELVVQCLEANGAIVIGKTNLPEFALGGNTVNDIFGATRNPWDTRMSASGSSGGSAAALAAGQVWLATGNDFGGSIRTPASFCSVAGLRPSAGMVARTQKQPFSALSVEGPMARNVADVALMFDAEVGFHPADALSQTGPHPSYRREAERPRRPARVAFSVDLGIAPVVDTQVSTVCKAAAERLAKEGVVVEEAHPDLNDAISTFLTLRGAIYIARMGPLLDTHRHLLKAEVIENAEFGLGLSAKAVVAAEMAQADLIRRMARFFEVYDLLLCPSVLCPPFDVTRSHIDQWNGVKFDGYTGWLALTHAISVTACPVMALPCGFTVDGLPIGLQVIGKPRGEAALFAQAAYMEAVLGIAGCTPVDPRCG